MSEVIKYRDRTWSWSNWVIITGILIILCAVINGYGLYSFIINRPVTTAIFAVIAALIQVFYNFISNKFRPKTAIEEEKQL